MAKSNKGHQAQLSPENYVKTRARTLPVHTCYINEEWRESGLANILVTRKHTTCNITFGVYLVDLFALGTKDTFYNFNQPEAFLNDFIERPNMIEAEYSLVHNIIYGANEFAEENESKIHKDFYKVTQFILEADDEKTPFIELEFGKDGKPFVIVLG